MSSCVAVKSNLLRPCKPNYGPRRRTNVVGARYSSVINTRACIRTNIMAL